MCSCVLPTRDALDRLYAVNWPLNWPFPLQAALRGFFFFSPHATCPFLYFISSPCTRFSLQSPSSGWWLLPVSQCTTFSLSISWFPLLCLFFFLSLALLHIFCLCSTPRKMSKVKCVLLEMARAALLSLFKTLPTAAVLTCRPLLRLNLYWVALEKHRSLLLAGGLSVCCSVLVPEKAR